MVQAASLVLLGILGGVTGVSSASLAVSAYSVLLPVLANGFSLTPVEALFVCFAIDCLNGFMIGARYRKRLKPKYYRQVFVGCAIVALVACLVAATIGIRFIKRHGEKVKHGVAYIDFLMGLGFLYKFYKHGNTDDDDASDADVEQPLLEEEDGGGPVPIELDIGGNETIESACSKFACTVGYFTIVAAVAGIIGFGGGNAFAIYYIIVYKWETISSTGASGFLSGFMTLSLLITYGCSGYVRLGHVTMYVLICLPTDIIGVILASRFAKQLSEQALCAFVAVMLFGIGIFGTVYSIVQD
mmetsp:Transcript_4286/g.6329  ORF Transcript_4286/g.6329 Transcript_4286/m.6329 type:complete len:300 (-) Transcript_4286:1129-2028(-)